MTAARISDGRVIDLSRKAAETIDMHDKGLARVRVSVLPDHSRQIAALAKKRTNVGAMGRYHRAPEHRSIADACSTATDPGCCRQGSR